MQYYPETSQYFTEKNYLLKFRYRKNWKGAGIQKLNFSSSCFTANDIYEKGVWLHVVNSSENDIFHFGDNIHLLKYYAVEVPQNCFNHLSSLNWTWFKFCIMSEWNCNVR